MNKISPMKPWILVVIAVILIGNLVVSNTILHETLKRVLSREVLHTEHYLTNELIVSELTRKVGEISTPLQVLSQDTFIKKWIQQGEPDADEIIPYLKTIQSSTDVESCYLISERTRRYYSEDSVSSFSSEKLDNAWYTEFKDSPEQIWFITKKQQGLNGSVFLSINYKIVDEVGQFLGVTGFVMDFMFPTRLLAEYSEEGRRILFFLTGKGSLVSPSASYTDTGFLQSTDYLEALESATEEELREGLIIRGIESYEVGYMRSLPNTGWLLFDFFDQDIVFGRISRALVVSFVINSFAIGVSLVLCILLIRSYQKRMKDLAMKDTLTGVTNRTMFTHIINYCLQSPQKDLRHHRFTLLLIDIDWFKQINDLHGHLAGDEALKSTATVIKENIRTTDNISRWGGEEFAVVLGECKLEEGLVIAEKLRAEIEQAEINFYQDGRPMTVSIGVAERHESDTKDGLMKRADKALYNAKESGRNRVRHCL